MHTKLMKWLSVAALLWVGMGFATGSNRIVSDIVVCVSALLVVTQAIRARKYLWAAGFSLVAVLFNPIAPIVLSGNTSLLVAWICLLAFLVSLFTLRVQPTLSIPSITDRGPRTEAL